ncbi:gamma-glutamylcyclotransferase [Manduca sexta]|uniref:gamma-glutamylcyclotransferase n=1 Tax=Manduca sexta TaxID=7130 RepID=A0A921Z3N4_MANSE|nr:gamma-glutamylcyclotransferase [Manduca sexta]KAG6450518.1 hypothetical protein O3G_MSEX006634 [Manduca sexta]
MLRKDVYKPDTFLYFSYGGNLLTARVRMHNPSAEFVSIARLDNYRMDFIKYSKFWGGPTATLVPTANSHVWGVVWRLHRDDMVSLDDQKGVDVKKYYIKYVEVSTPYMGSFLCRAYIQKVNPLPRGDNDVIPVERWPSFTLKEVMIHGAREHGFPEYYIQSLKKLKHNGEEGYLRAAFLLMRYAKDKPCECRVAGRLPRKHLKLDLRKLRNTRK